MKKITGILIIAIISCMTSTSCKTPEGCESTEQMQKTMLSGSDKKGTSNLFSKKQRKKMKKRRG